MSDESQSNRTGGCRKLREEERDLISYLLRGDDRPRDLETALASDMSDGGMGSIRFCGPKGRVLGRCVAEAQYLDVDGVLVSIVVNTDDRGELFELDMWKVDFSPLIRYPKPAALFAQEHLDESPRTQ
jgi:hypothetical protein